MVLLSGVNNTQHDIAKERGGEGENRISHLVYLSCIGIIADTHTHIVKDSGKGVCRRYCSKYAACWPSWWGRVEKSLAVWFTAKMSPRKKKNNYKEKYFLNYYFLENYCSVYILFWTVLVTLKYRLKIYKRLNLTSLCGQWSKVPKILLIFEYLNFLVWKITACGKIFSFFNFCSQGRLKIKLVMFQCWSNSNPFLIYSKLSIIRKSFFRMIGDPESSKS